MQALVEPSYAVDAVAGTAHLACEAGTYWTILLG